MMESIRELAFTKRGIFVVIVILMVSFYFGNFALMKSNTQWNVQLGSVKDANATFKEGFCIYPDSHFGKLVERELKNRGYKATILNSPVKCEGQFLAVEIRWLNVTYSPVFAKGSIEALAVYSSAGDPTHYLKYKNSGDKRAVLITFEKQGEIQAYILADIFDESKGITSLRGYKEYLLESAAKAVVKAVEDLYEP